MSYFILICVERLKMFIWVHFHRQVSILFLHKLLVPLVTSGHRTNTTLLMRKRLVHRCHRYHHHRCNCVTLAGFLCNFKSISNCKPWIGQLKIQNNNSEHKWLLDIYGTVMWIYYLEIMMMVMMMMMMMMDGDDDKASADVES